jgi:hypothetical protein
VKRVAIHGVPRSGSTWLGCILDSNPSVAYRYQPLFSYAFKDALSLASSNKDITTFFNDIYNSKDAFINQIEAKERGIVPKFKKENIDTVIYKEVRYHNLLEHLLMTDNDLKVIGLVRNPLAVLASWYNAPREFRKDLGWDFMEEWNFAKKKNQGRAEEFYGYHKWKEVFILFQRLEKEYPQRFYMVNYDELLTNTEMQISELFEFLDLELGKETFAFIHNSKNLNQANPYSVFKQKGLDNKWKEGLPESLVREVLIDLENSGLTTDFRLND